MHRLSGPTGLRATGRVWQRHLDVSWSLKVNATGLGPGGSEEQRDGASCCGQGDQRQLCSGHGGCLRSVTRLLEARRSRQQQCSGHASRPVCSAGSAVGGRRRQALCRSRELLPLCRLTRGGKRGPERLGSSQGPAALPRGNKPCRATHPDRLERSWGRDGDAGFPGRGPRWGRSRASRPQWLCMHRTAWCRPEGACGGPRRVTSQGRPAGQWRRRSGAR